MIQWHELEKDLSFNDLVVFRKLGEMEFQAHVELKGQKDQEKKENGGWFSFWKAEEEVSLTEEERRDLYNRIDYHETIEKASKLLPEDYIHTTVDVQFANMQCLLRMEDQPLMEGSLAGSFGLAQRRKWSTITTSIGDLLLRDLLTPDTKFKNIIATTPGQPILTADVDVAPMDSPFDAKVDLQIRPISAVISPELLGSIIKFTDLKVASHLKDVAWEQLKDFSHRTQVELARALAQQQTLWCSVSIRSPVIYVPLTPSDANSPSAIVDLGHCCIRSDGAENTQKYIDDYKLKKIAEAEKLKDSPVVESESESDSDFEDCMSEEEGLSLEGGAADQEKLEIDVIGENTGAELGFTKWYLDLKGVGCGWCGDMVERKVYSDVLAPFNTKVIVEVSALSSALSPLRASCSVDVDALKLFGDLSLLESVLLMQSEFMKFLPLPTFVDETTPTTGIPVGPPQGTSLSLQERLEDLASVDDTPIAEVNFVLHQLAIDLQVGKGIRLEGKCVKVSLLQNLMTAHIKASLTSLTVEDTTRDISSSLRYIISSQPRNVLTSLVESAKSNESLLTVDVTQYLTPMAVARSGHHTFVKARMGTLLGQYNPETAERLVKDAEEITDILKRLIPASAQTPIVPSTIPTSTALGGVIPSKVYVTPGTGTPLVCAEVVLSGFILALNSEKASCPIAVANLETVEAKVKAFVDLVDVTASVGDLSIESCVEPSPETPLLRILDTIDSHTSTIIKSSSSDDDDSDREPFLALTLQAFPQKTRLGDKLMKHSPSTMIMMVEEDGDGTETKSDTLVEKNTEEHSWLIADASVKTNRSACGIWRQDVFIALGEYVTSGVTGVLLHKAVVEEEQIESENDIITSILEQKAESWLEYALASFNVNVHSLKVIVPSDPSAMDLNNDDVSNLALSVSGIQVNNSFTIEDESNEYLIEPSFGHRVYQHINITVKEVNLAVENESVLKAASDSTCVYVNVSAIVPPENYPLFYCSGHNASPIEDPETIVDVKLSPLVLGLTKAQCQSIFKVVDGNLSITPKYDPSEFPLSCALGRVPWLNDEVSDQCLECGTYFSRNLPRHRCSSCGRIVCWKCCNNQIYDTISKSPQRVCGSCVGCFKKAKRQGLPLQQSLVTFPDHDTIASRLEELNISEPEHKKQKEESTSIPCVAINIDIPGLSVDLLSNTAVSSGLSVMLGSGKVKILNGRNGSSNLEASAGSLVILDSISRKGDDIVLACAETQRNRWKKENDETPLALMQAFDRLLSISRDAADPLIEVSTITQSNGDVDIKAKLSTVSLLPQVSSFIFVGEFLDFLIANGGEENSEKGDNGSNNNNGSKKRKNNQQQQGPSLLDAAPVQKMGGREFHQIYLAETPKTSFDVKLLGLQIMYPLGESLAEGEGLFLAASGAAVGSVDPREGITDCNFLIENLEATVEDISSKFSGIGQLGLLTGGVGTLSCDSFSLNTDAISQHFSEEDLDVMPSTDTPLDNDGFRILAPTHGQIRLNQTWDTTTTTKQKIDVTTALDITVGNASLSIKPSIMHSVCSKVATIIPEIDELVMILNNGGGNGESLDANNGEDVDGNGIEESKINEADEVISYSGSSTSTCVEQHQHVIIKATLKGLSAVVLAETEEMIEIPLLQASIGNIQSSLKAHAGQFALATVSVSWLAVRDLGRSEAGLALSVSDTASVRTDFTRQTFGRLTDDELVLLVDGCDALESDDSPPLIEAKVLQLSSIDQTLPKEAEGVFTQPSGSFEYTHGNHKVTVSDKPGMGLMTGDGIFADEMELTETMTFNSGHIGSEMPTGVTASSFTNYNSGDDNLDSNGLGVLLPSQYATNVTVHVRPIAVNWNPETVARVENVVQTFISSLDLLPKPIDNTQSQIIDNSSDDSSSQAMSVYSTVYNTSSWGRTLNLEAKVESISLALNKDRQRRRLAEIQVEGVNVNVTTVPVPDSKDDYQMIKATVDNITGHGVIKRTKVPIVSYPHSEERPFVEVGVFAVVPHKVPTIPKPVTLGSRPDSFVNVSLNGLEVVFLSQFVDELSDYVEQGLLGVMVHSAVEGVEEVTKAESVKRDGLDISVSDISVKVPISLKQLDEYISLSLESVAVKNTWYRSPVHEDLLLHRLRVSLAHAAIHTHNGCSLLKDSWSGLVDVEAPLLPDPDAMFVNIGLDLSSLDLLLGQEQLSLILQVVEHNLGETPDVSFIRSQCVNASCAVLRREVQHRVLPPRSARAALPKSCFTCDRDFTAVGVPRKMCFVCFAHVCPKCAKALLDSDRQRMCWVCSECHKHAETSTSANEDANPCDDFEDKHMKEQQKQKQQQRQSSIRHIYPNDYNSCNDEMNGEMVYSDSEDSAFEEGVVRYEYGRLRPSFTETKIKAKCLGVSITLQNALDNGDLIPLATLSANSILASISLDTSGSSDITVSVGELALRDVRSDASSRNALFRDIVSTTPLSKFAKQEELLANTESRVISSMGTSGIPESLSAETSESESPKPQDVESPMSVELGPLWVGDRLLRNSVSGEALSLSIEGREERDDIQVTLQGLRIILFSSFLVEIANVIEPVLTPLPVTDTSIGLEPIKSAAIKVVCIGAQVIMVDQAHLNDLNAISWVTQLHADYQLNLGPATCEEVAESLQCNASRDIIRSSNSPDALAQALEVGQFGRRTHHVNASVGCYVCTAYDLMRDINRNSVRYLFDEVRFGAEISQKFRRHITFEELSDEDSFDSSKPAKLKRTNSQLVFSGNLGTERLPKTRSRVCFDQEIPLKSKTKVQTLLVEQDISTAVGVSLPDKMVTQLSFGDVDMLHTILSHWAADLQTSVVGAKAREMQMKKEEEMNPQEQQSSSTINPAISSAPTKLTNQRVSHSTSNLQPADNIDLHGNGSVYSVMFKMGEDHGLEMEMNFQSDYPQVVGLPLMADGSLSPAQASNLVSLGDELIGCTSLMGSSPSTIISPRQRSTEEWIEEINHLKTKGHYSLMFRSPTVAPLKRTTVDGPVIKLNSLVSEVTVTTAVPGGSNGNSFSFCVVDDEHSTECPLVRINLLNLSANVSLVGEMGLSVGLQWVLLMECFRDQIHNPGWSHMLEPCMMVAKIKQIPGEKYRVLLQGVNSLSVRLATSHIPPVLRLVNFASRISEKVEETIAELQEIEDRIRGVEKENPEDRFVIPRDSSNQGEGTDAPTSISQLRPLGRMNKKKKAQFHPYQLTNHSEFCLEWISKSWLKRKMATIGEVEWRSLGPHSSQSLNVDDIVARSVSNNNNKNGEGSPKTPKASENLPDSIFIRHVGEDRLIEIQLSSTTGKIQRRLSVGGIHVPVMTETRLEHGCFHTSFLAAARVINHLSDPVEIRSFDDESFSFIVNKGEPKWLSAEDMRRCYNASLRPVMCNKRYNWGSRLNLGQTALVPTASDPADLIKDFPFKCIVDTSIRGCFEDIQLLPPLRVMNLLPTTLNYIFTTKAHSTSPSGPSNIPTGRGQIPAGRDREVTSTFPDSKLRLALSVEGYKTSASFPVQITKGRSKKVEVMLYGASVDYESTTKVEVEINRGQHGQYFLTVYTPTWVINRSGYPLRVACAENNMYKCGDSISTPKSLHNTLYPTDSASGPSSENIQLLARTIGAPSIADCGKPSMMMFHPPSDNLTISRGSTRNVWEWTKQSNGIPLTRGDTQIQIQDGSIVHDLNVKIQSAPGVFHRTKIVTIYPTFQILNCTSSQLILDTTPSETTEGKTKAAISPKKMMKRLRHNNQMSVLDLTESDQIAAEVGQLTPVHWQNGNGQNGKKTDVSLQLLPTQEEMSTCTNETEARERNVPLCSGRFPLDVVSETALLLSQPPSGAEQPLTRVLRVVVSPGPVGVAAFLLTIKEEQLSAPLFAIQNFSTQPIYYYQHCCMGSPLIVNPGVATPMGWAEPRQSMGLTVAVQPSMSNPQNFTFDELDKRKMLSPGVFGMVTLRGRTRVLAISDRQEHLTPVLQPDMHGPWNDISVHLKGLELSVEMCDTDTRGASLGNELLHVSLGELNASILQTDEHVKARIRLQQLELDNHLPDAYYPVVLRQLKKKSHKPVLDIHVQVQSNGLGTSDTIIVNFADLTIGHLTLNVDEIFVRHLLDYVDFLIQQNHKVAVTNESYDRNEVGSGGIDLTLEKFLRKSVKASWCETLAASRFEDLVLFFNPTLSKSTTEASTAAQYLFIQRLFIAPSRAQVSLHLFSGTNLGGDDKSLEIGTRAETEDEFEAMLRRSQEAQRESLGKLLSGGAAWLHVLKTFVSLDEAPLTLVRFERKNEMLSAATFGAIMKRYGQANISNNQINLLLSLPMLGNVAGLVRGVKSGFENFNSSHRTGVAGFGKNVGSSGVQVMQNTVGGLLGSLSGVTRQVTKTTAALTFDDKYINASSERMSKQSKSLRKGVMGLFSNTLKSVGDGLVGVVEHPIKGAKKRTFSGFAKGLAKGVTGVITKPVSGVVGGATQLMQGAKSQMTGNLKPKRSTRHFR
eukprot:TRINITY_DN3920_c0_g1_i2.p1 TRINITY_DN3920_c0_g1~~TRINITY_DN3920_c0_g1_i2.p1  ORF type:complete len:4458 (-),score=1496.99 TRINITY_DN3920_c0_g1_i2:257-13630(-)